MPLPIRLDLSKRNVRGNKDLKKEGITTTTYKKAQDTEL